MSLGRPAWLISLARRGAICEGVAPALSVSSSVRTNDLPKKRL